MTPRSNALLAVFLMLAVGLADPVSAWHNTPDDTDHLEDPPLMWSGTEDAGTGVQPVDRNSEPAFQAADDANRTFSSSYHTIIGGGLNAIDDQRSRTARLPLTLFRDGAGGRPEGGSEDAGGDPDRLQGGFGDPRFLGTHSWDHDGDAAFDGDMGYTSPVNPDGTYPRFSQSLLVTPEIDLRTNQFMERRVEKEQRDQQEHYKEGFQQVDQELQAQCAEVLGELPQQQLAGLEVKDLIRDACLAGETFNAPLDAEVVSSVYVATYWACDTGYVSLYALGGVPAIGPFTAAAVSLGHPAAGIGCFAYRDLLEQQETYTTFGFSHRHNLAAGRDGVSVMVFTQPPTMQAAQACATNPGAIQSPEAYQASPADGQSPITRGARLDGGVDGGVRPQMPPCQIALPESGQRGGGYQFNLAPMPNQAGFTGTSSGWVHDAIDLTPWSGQSVWIGFFFGSGVVGGPSYFQDPDLFVDPDAGFYGFQVDDLEVRSPAAQVNLGIRPIREPSFVPPNTDGVVTLDPSTPIPILTEVTNLGSKEVETTTVTRVLRADRSVAHALAPVNETLPPAAYMVLSQQVAGLEVGSYILQVCTARVPTDATGGDAGFCDAPVPKGGCSSDTLEAAPCDRVRELRFDLRPVQAISHGPLTLSQDAIAVNDDMTATLTLRNDGTAPETVQVRGTFVDIVTGDLVEDLLALEDRVAKTVRIDPAEEASLQWDIIGKRQGQYRFLVQINNSDAAPRPFDAEYDLLPQILQPWRSSPFVWDPDLQSQILNGTPALTDHFLDVGGTRVAVGNNATHLLLAFSNTTASGITVYLNDLADGDLGSGGGGVAATSDGDVMGIRHDGDRWVFPVSSLATIAAGKAHTLATTEDGNVFAWGSGGSGQLGNGATPAAAASPVRVVEGDQTQSNGLLEDVAGIAAGDAHTLAFTRDGALFAWGSASNGRLGQGGTVGNIAEPVRVLKGAQASSSAYLEGVSNVSAGAAHSLAVADGAVVAWGLQASGRLGNGLTTLGDVVEPVRVLKGEQESSSAYLEDIETVAAGGAHSLALTADGNVFAWGDNQYGQLGNGQSGQTRGAPVRVLAGAQSSASGFLEDVVAVAAGDQHSLALTEDGSVYAWGSSDYGQLGNGRGRGARADGSLQHGQSATAPAPPSPSPIRVLAGAQSSASGFLEDVVAVAAGDQHSLALTEDGSVFAWGYNGEGNLGVGVTSFGSAIPPWSQTGVPQKYYNALTPRQVISGDQINPTGFLGGVAGIAGGGDHSLAKTREGAVYAWGLDDSEQVGNGPGAEPREVAPARVLGGEQGRTSLQLVLPEDTTGIRGERASTLERNQLNNFDHYLEIPVDGATLTAGPGDHVGMLVWFCTLPAGQPCNQQFPASAPMFDGDGFLPADGDLADELVQWHTIRIVAPEAPSGSGGASPYAENVLSGTFGVGTNIPSYFFQDFQKCPSFLGWAQQLPPSATSGGMVDQWNCADYPEDGRTLLYKGVSPDSTCDGECLPYAGIPAAPFGVDTHLLTTPPIEIPTTARDPVVVLAHQYSTDAQLEDRNIVDGNSGSLMSSTGRIQINHQLSAALQQWDEAQGGWVPVGPLTPEGGYPSEESTGVRDPRFPPRQYYSNPNCPPIGTTPSFSFSAAACAFTPTSGSWWWPQGPQPTHRPADQTIAGIPATDPPFHGGSPWTVDRIPLDSVQTVDGQTADLRGETVRVQFSFTTQPTADRSPEPDLEDWGWRIAAIAVKEDAPFVHDVSITDARPLLPYDPLVDGVGPNTTVPVLVTIRNDGEVQADNVIVHLFGDDPRLPTDDAGRELCRQTHAVTGVLLPGETRDVTLDCTLGEDVTAGVLALRATVEMEQVKDHFPGNNHFRVRGHFPLTASPAAGITVGVDPVDSARGQERDITIRLQNEGNVPLTDATVRLEVFDISGTSPEQATIPRTWPTTTPLQVGTEHVALQNITAALVDPPTFKPEDTGIYLARATLSAPGLPGDVLAETRFRALDTFFLADFDRAPSAPTPVMQGGVDAPHGWTVMANDGVGGSARLQVGDPALGEIPADNDTALVLPPIDLSAVKSATLTFDHRFDLEPGFDAARVEMSTDNGTTWVPLVPRSQPASGLPDGYSSTPIIGVNAILGQDVECSACAYTGRSADLEGSDAGGWVSAEFDLTRQPGFWREAPVETFLLDGMAPDARPSPFPGSRFYDPSWVLDEPQAQANQRHWWIDNVTHTEPRPVAGSKMWWSGSAGEKMFATGEMPPVDTTLEFQVPVDPTWHLDDADQVVLSFWDWRPGWQDSADGERSGTGGLFNVKPLIEGGDGALDVQVVERSPSGWTRREINLTSLADQEGLGAAFTYVSGTATNAPERGSWHMAEIENNRGWFIDGLQIIRRDADGATVVARNDAGNDVGVQSWSNEGTTEWHAIRAGEAAREGGWRIGPAEVPGRGDVPAWLLQADNVQGYPNNVDSRVVTPVIDLRTYGGDSVRFTFDHRYQFHGERFDPASSLLGRAIDGGMVEVQVWDQQTRSFGPWRSLGAQEEPPILGFQGQQQRDWTVALDDTSLRPALDAMGYPSIAASPSPADADFDPTVQPNDIRITPWADRPAGSKVSGESDMGTLYLENMQQLGAPGSTAGPIRLEFVDRDGDQAFGGADDAYLVAGQDSANSLYRFRLEPVTYGSTTYPAGSMVQGGDADAGAAFRQVLTGTAVPGRVQWVDRDGDGDWSRHDAAYFTANAFNGDGPASAVGLGDIRLTFLEDQHVPSQVVAGDADVGAPLQPRGTFQLCRSGEPAPVYLTAMATTCGQGHDWMHQGTGHGFPTSPGWLRPVINRNPSATDFDRQFQSSHAYPVAQVFSGDSCASATATACWDHVDWDVSHLTGKQVRFAFHAWTNPSEEPCSNGDDHPPEFFGRPLSGWTAIFGEPSTQWQRDPCLDLPLDGWSIANVQVQGQQFQGEEALIRFRAATDGSMTKGEWSLDNVRVVGERYQKSVLIRSDQTDILGAPGETVTFEGKVANLGAKTRTLALAIESSHPGAVRVQDPAGLPSIHDGLPAGIDHALGPFTLTEAGSTQSTLPVRLEVDLPEGAVDIRLTVLEKDECDDGDGGSDCTPQYRRIQNERGVGPASIAWHAIGMDVDDIRLVSPTPGVDAAIVADPGVAERIDGAWQPVHFQSAVHNNGTTTPDLHAVWTVHQVERKGSAAQPGTKEVLEPRATQTIPLDDVPRDETSLIEYTFTDFQPGDDGKGLYRTVLEIRDGDDAVVARSTLEFLAGDVEAYYLMDFATQDAAADGWTDAPPVGPEAFGQTPGGIGFRQEDDAFIWGLNQSQFNSGLEYCYQGGCNPNARSTNYEEAAVTVGEGNDAQGGEDQFGLHAIAKGPIVPLTQVVGDEAVLTLRHGHVFAPRDGAVVEALPLRHPVNPSLPQSQFACRSQEDSGTTADMWFRLQAHPSTPLDVDETGYPSVTVRTGTSNRGGPLVGQTSPRINPVDLEMDGPIIGGPGTSSEFTQFSMHGAPTPVCPPGFAPPDGFQAPPNLVNYTVQLRLRVGTTPGINDPDCTSFNNAGRCVDNPRTGAMGWQVHGLGISSMAVRIDPPDGRALPMLDGIDKRFNVQVTNLGAVPDTFHFGLAESDPEEDASIVTDWFHFPVQQVHLAPGQTRTVPFEVNIPSTEGLQRGTYTTHLQATSGLDPNIISQSKIDVVLLDHPLPDLAAELEVQVDTDVPHPGEVARIAVTVHNLPGGRASSGVPLKVQATLLNETGHDVETSIIGTKQVPPLAPDEVKLEVLQWTPKSAGTYRVEAIADPEGRLIERDKANSRVEAIVKVVPADRAVVRFTDLTFDGVGDDGYALEGSLVTINASLRNDGDSSSKGGTVFLWAGSTELTSVDLGAMAPGNTTTVTALRVASPGEIKVRALYLPDDAAGEDAHELARILRVRGLDLSYEAPTHALEFTPGDTLTTQVNVTNDGNAVEKVVFTLDSRHDGWALAATPNPVTVAPQGGTAWTVLSLQAPEGAVAGEYDVFVLAAPRSQSDVPQRIAIPVHVASDIQAPALGVGNATGVPGPLTVPVTITSTSNAAQDMQIFTDPVGWLPEPLNVTLGPGVQEVLDLVIHVPGTTRPGNQTVGVIIKDLDNTTLVKEETTVLVLPRENGAAAWSGNRTSRTVDLTTREFAIDLNFTNTGNVPVRPYVVLSSLTAGAEAVPMDMESMPSVAPGDSVHLPVAVRVGHEFGGAVTGTAAVFMQVADETANAYKDVLVAQLGIPDLGYLPDLAIKDVRFTPRGVVDAGDPVTIEATFENLGRTETPATTLYAYVNGEAVNVYEVQALQAGESVQINLTWAFPASGEYLVHLVADGDDKVTELHDDNNGWTQGMTVEPGSLFQQAKEAPLPALPFILLALALAALIVRRRGQ